MKLTKDACTSAVLNKLWDNQVAIVGALYVIATWLDETGQDGRSAIVRQVAEGVMRSKPVVETALETLAKVGLSSLDSANDADESPPSDDL